MKTLIGISLFMTAVLSFGTEAVDIDVIKKNTPKDNEIGMMRCSVYFYDITDDYYIKVKGKANKFGFINEQVYKFRAVFDEMAIDSTDLLQTKKDLTAGVPNGGKVDFYRKRNKNGDLIYYIENNYSKKGMAFTACTN